MFKSSRIKMLMAVAALALAPMVASAQARESFEISTGAKDGTYNKVANDLIQFCPNLGMVNIGGAGTLANIELLAGNKTRGAFVQSDILAYYKKFDPNKVAEIKTIDSLYPEELHFIARSGVKKEGMFSGVGIGTKVSFNTIKDLAGRPVGGVGGSMLSGQIAASQTGIPFQMREYKDNEALKAALLNGEVDAILVVGGAPHDLVSSLTEAYKILAVPQDVLKAVAGENGIYSPAQLSYNNLRATGVWTLSTQSLFVSRTFRSKAVLQQLADIRACFQNKLGDIQDAKGTHPKWQKVDGDDKGRWTWYDLPAGK